MFVCFHWLWYFIDFLFAFSGLGSVRLAAFVSVSLLCVWRHHCSSRGMFLSYLKWKNNVIEMTIYMIGMFVWI